MMPEDIVFEQQQQRLANQRQQQLENSSRSSSKEMDGSISSHKKTRRGRRGRGVRAAKAKGGRVRGAGGEHAGTYITNRRVDLQVGVCADFYSYLVLWYSALRPQRLQCTKRCRVPEV